MNPGLALGQRLALVHYRLQFQVPCPAIVLQRKLHFHSSRMLEYVCVFFFLMAVVVEHGLVYPRQMYFLSTLSTFDWHMPWEAHMNH